MVGETGEERVSLRRITDNEIARKAAKALGWAATLALLGVLLLTSFLMIAPFFGLQAYTVLSGSMEPALKVGGVTICRSVPVEDIKVGDIIAFNNLEGVKITHRVTSVAEEDGVIKFHTKGDANEEEDPNEFSINGDHVHKVVFHIPYLGYLYSFIRSKVVFLTVIFGSALILLTFFGREMRTALAAVRGKKKPACQDSDVPEG